MKKKQYIVNVSDGRFSDWYIVDEKDIPQYAKYGNYASIWLVNKRLTEEEKEKLIKRVSA